MKFFISESRWRNVKKTLLRKYPNLTDSDLTNLKDDVENIICRIEEKLQLSKKEVTYLLSSLSPDY